MNISEINTKLPYLALYRYNSKRIIWQLCRVISTTPIKNKNGYDVLPIRFFDGKESTVYVRDNMTVDSLGQISLKQAPEKWLTREIIKHTDIINEHTRHVDKLINFYYND
jgi:hypothetical protein